MSSGASTGRFSGGWATIRRRSELLQGLGLAAVALTLYLFELGKGALPDWDSAIYAEVTKEMVQGHHWLTPYWNHHPFFEKPPLFNWLQMIPFGVLGRTEFAARLESSLAGVAVVMLVYAMTRRTAGGAAGLFAGLVLLTTHFFDQTMRRATTDSLLCCCIYLTVYGYVRLREGDGRWFYLMCAALGLGIMTKGPAALVAPMAIGLDWGFRSRKKLVTARQLWMGLLLLGAIAVPWHVWMVWRYGWAYVNDYLGYQIVARASRPLEGNIGGLLFYFKVIGRGGVSMVRSGDMGAGSLDLEAGVGVLAAVAADGRYAGTVYGGADEAGVVCGSFLSSAGDGSGPAVGRVGPEMAPGRIGRRGGACGWIEPGLLPHGAMAGG